VFSQAFREQDTIRIGHPYYEIAPGESLSEPAHGMQAGGAEERISSAGMLRGGVGLSPRQSGDFSEPVSLVQVPCLLEV